LIIYLLLMLFDLFRDLFLMPSAKLALVLKAGVWFIFTVRKQGVVDLSDQNLKTVCIAATESGA